MLLTATVAIVLASLEAGYRLGVFRHRRSDSEKETPVGEVVAATLGLLAFLLAFTFGFAASRFESRKELVIQEANAVGTAWLRAGLLPAPESTESRNLYRDSVASAWKESRPGTLPSRSDSRDTDDVRQVVWGKIAALPPCRSCGSSSAICRIRRSSTLSARACCRPCSGISPLAACSCESSRPTRETATCCAPRAWKDWSAISDACSPWIKSSRSLNSSPRTKPRRIADADE